MTGLPSDLPIEEIVESNGLYDMRRALDDFGEAWQARDPQGNPIALVRAETAHAATSRAERAEAERDEARWHQERCHRHHEASDAEAAELRRQVDAVRALHSPKPGWEAQWKDPAEALARGWIECAGCELQPAGAGRYIKDCRTLAALDGTADTREADHG